MKFIRSRTSIHYKADFQNHLSYLPPIEVLKRTISSAHEKCKATVIDEGTCPLDGQFRKAASYSTNDDSATHDTSANASKQNPQAIAPRVMTGRELFLSFHQKVAQVGQASVCCNSLKHDGHSKLCEEESLLSASSLRPHLGYSFTCLHC